MSKSDSKVAKRYARALFESCSPKNYDAVGLALQDLSSALAENDIRTALLNPSLSLDQRTRWLTDIFAATCPEEAKSLGNLFAVIMQNRRVDSLGAISKFFSEILVQYKKLLELEVISAKELSEAERADLSQKVKSKLPSEVAAGLSFDWKTETELLGGLQVKVGDKLLDGSVSGAINKIARQLRA